MGDEISTIEGASLIGSALGDRMLALNNAHAEELSLLDADHLKRLIDHAFLALSVGEGDAFLIAFDQDAAYDNPNFNWFRERLDGFVYVDRIVVDARARGRGFARRLYDELFRRARQAGHDRIVCEVNSRPPNPASDAFHADLGFVEMGAGVIHGGAKSVRYLSRRLVVDEQLVRA